MAEDRRNDDKTQSYFVLSQGAVVGHYRIIEKIGAGGMGEVYLAQDTELDRKVALKFLPSHLCKDEDCRKRFKREAQAAAKLDHPNIVHVYEVSEHHGRPFFAMQHVTGNSLSDLIKGKELGLDRVIDLAIGVCDGLREAHEAGIVHRDVKPSNVIIDKNGQPKLLDFGLAAVTGTTKLTKTGSTLGTIGYMSPEQIQGQKVDLRSDLFSFGVVLYELITGQRPFKGDNEAAINQAIVAGTPEPLARYKAGVPDELQQVVDRALDKKIETRYPSAAAMLADLKRMAASGSRPVMVSAREKRAKKLRWAAAISLVIIVAVWGSLQLKHWLAPAKAQAKSLAVLFFENLGAENESYLASGLAEDLAIKLRNVAGFRVASSADIRRLSKKDLLAKDVASNLGVQYALGGSLLREGEQIRVTVELIDEKTGDVIWSEQFNREFTEVFQFIDEISQRIAQALEVHLIPAEQLALREQPTDSPEAYDHYLKGRHYYYNVTFRDNELAEKEFQIALQLDPDYPLALAGLADVYVQRYGEAFDFDEYWLDSADVLVSRALELNKDLAEAYEARAEVLFEKGNYLGALEAAEMAKNLRPDLDEPYVRLGEIYQKRGERRKALDMYNKALSIRPSIDALCGKMRIFTARGDIDSAEAIFQMACELNPEHEQPYLVMANYYEEVGRLLEAEQYYWSAIELRPDRGYTYLALMWLLEILPADTKERVEPEKLLRDFIEKYPYNWVGYYNLHSLLAWGRQQFAAALEVVQQAVERNPDRAWPHLLLAESYAWNMSADIKKEDAVEAVERALELRPNSSSVHEWAGRIFGSMDSTEKAMSYCSAGLKINPGSSGILSQMGQLLLRAGMYDSAAVIALKAIEQTPGIPGMFAWMSNYIILRNAMAHLQRTDEYLEILQQATDKYGEDNPQFYTDLGREKCYQGNFREAIALFERHLDIKVYGHTYRSLGMAQWLAGDLDSALASYYKAGEVDAWFASYPRLLRNLSLLKYMKRFDAIEELLVSLKEPGVPDGIWNFVANAYYGSMRRFDDAPALATENSANDLVETARLYRLKGDFEKAKQVLDKAYPTLSSYVRDDADSERARIAAIEGNLTQAVKYAQKAGDSTLCGRLHLAQGKPELALVAFTRASLYWDWWFTAGLRALYRRGQMENLLATEESEQVVKKSLSMATRERASGYRHMAVARCLCAMAAARLGDTARVYEEIEWVTRLEPERSDIAYNIACAYSLLGDTTLAFQWLETAVERGHQELWWARVDPDLDPLRDLPRFKEIMNDWDSRIQALLEKSE